MFRMLLDNPTPLDDIVELEPPLGLIPQSVRDEAYELASTLYSPGSDDFWAFIESYLDDVNTPLTNNNRGDYIREIEQTRIYFELKSFSRQGFQYFSDFDRNGSKTRQLKAYLDNVQSFDQLNYLFDWNKLRLQFDNQNEARQFIKERFQQMYQGRKNEFFEKIFENSGLRDELGLSGNPLIAFAEFEEQINDLTSTLYAIIKIE